MLVRVHAAALTRDELEWPTDRLPAIPSYEPSGVVAGIGEGVEGLAEGDEVYALMGFDRDGAAAEYATVPAAFVARKPYALSHAEGAALPLAGLSAWQALFDHGALEPGQRVLILGAAGGVGHLATQLALWRWAHVIGTATGGGVASSRALGAHEAIDPTTERFEDAEPVDLVFDTSAASFSRLARGSPRRRPARLGRRGAAARSRPRDHARATSSSNRTAKQLAELARLAYGGAIKPAIDSTFSLADGLSCFRRLAEPGKHGKVVLDLDM